MCSKARGTCKSCLFRAEAASHLRTVRWAPALHSQLSNLAAKCARQMCLPSTEPPARPSHPSPQVASPSPALLPQPGSLEAIIASFEASLAPARAAQQVVQPRAAAVNRTEANTVYLEMPVSGDASRPSCWAALCTTNWLDRRALQVARIPILLRAATPAGGAASLPAGPTVRGWFTADQVVAHGLVSCAFATNALTTLACRPHGRRSIQI